MERERGGEKWVREGGGGWEKQNGNEVVQFIAFFQVKNE